MRRLECDTASIRYNQGGFLSFYNKVYNYTYLFLGFLPLPDLLSNVLVCPWFFSHFRGSDHSCSLAVLFIINIKQPFTTFALPIVHLVCPPAPPPPKCFISWASICLGTTVSPRRNWEKMVTQNKAKRKQSVLWAIQKLRINPVGTCNKKKHVKVYLLLSRQVVTITPQRFESFLSWVW